MTNSSQTSAQIIPFPKGGRPTIAKTFESRAAETAPVTEALSGSWYHDEAIQEAAWAKKH